MTAYQLKTSQCLCGCRTPVDRNYAPGHDARHVATLVRETLNAWTDEYPMYATEQVWQRAIRVLPTDALRNKYRRRMCNIVMKSKHMAPIISGMNDPRWQADLRPTRDIYAVDAGIVYSSASTWWIAVVATAMGMSRHGINRRHS